LKDHGDEVPVVNDPGFELPIHLVDRTQSEFAIPAWVASANKGGIAELDFHSPAEGKSSLRMKATRETGPVSIVSRPFAVPRTGRITFSFKVRAPREIPSPLAVQVSASGVNYVSNVRVDKMLTPEFQEASVTFSDLPVDATNLQLRFQLVAPGELWIDQLHTSDKSLSQREKKELDRILDVTYDQLDVGDLLACYDTLSGYWPRFLLRHVKPAVVAPRNQVLPERTARREPKKQTLIDRFKKLRVPTLRLR